MHGTALHTIRYHNRPSAVWLLILWKRVLLHDFTTCCEWRHKPSKSQKSTASVYVFCLREADFDGSGALDKFEYVTAAALDIWLWSPWVLCHLNAVLCETLVSPSQAFSEDDVTQQLHARNLKVGWSDGAMEHTSSGFYFRFSLDLAILAYFRILAYSYCTCALPRRGISV